MSEDHEHRPRLAPMVVDEASRGPDLAGPHDALVKALRDPASLDMLRELSDAATPGPWKGCAHVNGTDPDCPCRYEGDIWDGIEERVVAFLGDCGCKHTDEDCRHLMVRTVAGEDREQGYANGRLITAAVNYVRAALAGDLQAGATEPRT